MRREPRQSRYVDQNQNYYRQSRMYDDYDDGYYETNERYNQRYIRNNPQDDKFEYKQGRKTRKEKEPKSSTLSAIKGLKLTSQVLYIVSVTLMALGWIVYYVMYKSKQAILYNNYVGDASFMMILGGSALGILAAVIFLLLFLMLFFNRRGWLRKSKAHLPGILATITLGLVSLYSLTISRDAIDVFTTSVGVSLIKYQDILTFYNLYILKYLNMIDIIPTNYITDFWNKLDVYLWGLVVCAGVAGALGTLYVKSLSKTLDNSEYYFSRRYYR